MRVTLIKFVKYDQVMGHFHIGANMPGYLPESEVVCTDNLADAIEYFINELDWSQDQLHDPDDYDADEYGRIESVKVSASDKNLHRQAYRELECFKAGTDTLSNLISFLHRPNQGTGIVHWISAHGDNRDECLIAEGQDW
jgi:hypothetical protein